MIPSDSQLRTFSFFGSIAAAALLLAVNWVKIRAKDLSPADILVREGLVALLVSAAYGTGEQLWHWYHLRLVILALAILWILVGLVWMVFELRHSRRHTPVPPKV